MTPFTQTDFSGGITDNYLSCAPNCYSIADNLSIDVNGKLYTRWGTFAYQTRVPTNGSNTRVSGIYLGDEPFGMPFSFRGPSVYFTNLSNGWTEVLGPASNSACPNKGVTDVEKAVLWRRQLIYACGNSANSILPHRIWCSASGGAYQAVTLGLPQVLLASLVVISTVSFTVSSASATLGATYTNNGNTFTVTATISSGTTLTTTGNGSPTASGTLTKSSGTGDATITFSAFAAPDNVAYAFHYDYQFTDYTSTLFEERGPVTTTAVFTATTTGTTTLSGLPVIVNTSSTNYDVTNIKLKIYRTINNGQSFYLVGSITNGTTTFTDSMSDATLITQPELYTDGGVLSYSPPPGGAKFVTQVNDFFWYVTDSTITHSVVGGPGECPLNYYRPLAQKAQGLSDILSFPILFCDRSVYRIDGVFDEFGGGGFTPYEISQTAGCVSNKSIVKIPGGLVWAGNGGFYFTDGYQVQKISFGLDVRYPTWKSQFNAGAYDSVKNQVVWSVSSAANSNAFPCDGFLVLHLRYGITANSVFTTWSSENNIFPTSIAFSESFDVSTTFRSKLLFGEARGYLLYQDPLSYTDPQISQLLFPVNFTKKAIIYRFESSALDLGGDALKKYCVDLTAELANETNIAIQFLSRRDDGGPWGTFSEIRSDVPPSSTVPSGGSGSIIWDISEYAWDDPSDLLTHDWDSQSLVEGRRYFPQGTLRSTRRQIGYTNSNTFVAISDVLGLCSVSGVRQVTLNAGAWPYDCEDYSIGLDPLSTGVYTYYKIKSRVSDTVISVYDPTGTFPSPISNLKWQMQGYRKFERANLLSFTVNFDQGSNTQNPSHGTAGVVNG